MSHGPYANSHKYAPGVSPEYGGKIAKILDGWKKAGIGVVREKGKK